MVTISVTRAMRQSRGGGGRHPASGVSRRGRPAGGQGAYLCADRATVLLRDRDFVARLRDIPTLSAQPESKDDSDGARANCSRKEEGDKTTRSVAGSAFLE